MMKTINNRMACLGSASLSSTILPVPSHAARLFIDAMKHIHILVSLGLIVLLVGCVSTPVILPNAVGPNPFRGARMMTSDEGELQVFSNLAEQSDDENQGSTDFIWYQPTDYEIYDIHGTRLKHVENTIGHYEKAPKTVSLPVGRYIVIAQARDYEQVKVPVTVERGRTTRVHLDGTWKPPMNTAKGKLVRLPNGKPIGWRANIQNPRY
jgi:hypothetical protein